MCEVDLMWTGSAVHHVDLMWTGSGFVPRVPHWPQQDLCEEIRNNGTYHVEEVKTMVANVRRSSDRLEDLRRIPTGRRGSGPAWGEQFGKSTTQDVRVAEWLRGV